MTADQIKQRLDVVNEHRRQRGLAPEEMNRWDTECNLLLDIQDGFPDAENKLLEFYAAHDYNNFGA